MTDESGDDDVEDDINSPDTRRRLWRRVWIGLAVFVLGTPMLLWVAVDQAGKREWERVRAELQALEVATDFEELAGQFRKADEVPEAENFCAIPWLRGRRDGGVSVAMEEMETALGVFDGNVSGIEDSWRLETDALSGEATEFAAWATHFREIQAQEADRAALWPSATEKKLSPVEERQLRIRQIAETEERREEGRLLSDAEAPKMVADAVENFHPSVWADLRQALPRPQSHFLPLASERLSELMGGDLPLPSSAINGAIPLMKALRLRMVVAAQVGDERTVRECFEIGTRFCEAAFQEPFFFGYLIETVFVEQWLAALAEVLWLPKFSENLDFLLFCQEKLERIDLAVSYRNGYVSELAFALEGVEDTKDSREYESYFDEISGAQELLLNVAPHGWFDLNGALFGELNLRFMLPALEGEFEFYEVRDAVDQMAGEISALSEIKRWNSFLVLSEGSFWEDFFRRGAYLETCRRQALIVCALRRWQIDHAGELPASLLMLVPKYLKKPENLIDPMDGSPLRYVVGVGDAEDAESAPAEFTLYSVGWDQVDDGGPASVSARPGRYEDPPRGSAAADWAWPVREFVLEEVEEEE